ncbi:MAG: SMI1/KNR4 family protein [Desulfobulbaceae bacterium]|nr:SMI1/KNR4 family protein [Desulfobulbaceae bacterium]
MDDFLKYAETFIDNFQNQIIGASKENIIIYDKMINERIGLRLPDEYLEFLTVMGCSTLPLKLTSDDYEDTDLREIITYYKDEPIPKNCIPISACGDSLDLGMEFYIKGEEPRIVKHDYGEINTVESDSFIKFLHRRVFIQFVTPVKNRRLYKSIKFHYTKPIVERKITELGFKKEWFSDSIYYCGKMDDGIGVAIYQNYKKGTSAEVILMYKKPNYSTLAKIEKELFEIDICPTGEPLSSSVVDYNTKLRKLKEG